jgi:hypothetical protein
MTIKLLCAGESDTSFQPIKLAFVDEDVTIIRATSIALSLFLARKNRPHLIICAQTLTDGKELDLLFECNNEQDLAKIPFAFLLTDSLKQAEILNSLANGQSQKNVHFLLPEREVANSDEFFSWKSEILKIILI